MPTPNYWNAPRELEFLQETLAKVAPKWNLEECYFWENVSSAYRSQSRRFRWLQISADHWKQLAAEFFIKQAHKEPGRRTTTDGIYLRIKKGKLKFDNPAHFASFWHTAVHTHANDLTKQAAKVTQREATYKHANQAAYQAPDNAATKRRGEIADDFLDGKDARDALSHAVTGEETYTEPDYETAADARQLVRAAFGVIEKGELLAQIGDCELIVKAFPDEAYYTLAGSDEVPCFFVCFEVKDGCLIGDKLSVLPVNDDGELDADELDAALEAVGECFGKMFSHIASDLYKRFGLRQVKPARTNDEILGFGLGIGDRAARLMTRKLATLYKAADNHRKGVT